MITWKEIPRPIRVILIIIMILLLLWFAANIYRILRKPPNAKYLKGEEGIPEGWTPTALTDSLFNLFSGADPLKSAVPMHEFNQLNDNQKIDVYNDWNDRKATESIFLGIGSYGTLTNSLDDELFLIGSNALREAGIMGSNLERLKLP